MFGGRDVVLQTFLEKKLGENTCLATPNWNPEQTINVFLSRLLRLRFWSVGWFGIQSGYP